MMVTHFLVFHPKIYECKSRATKAHAVSWIALIKGLKGSRALQRLLRWHRALPVALPPLHRWSDVSSECHSETDRAKPVLQWACDSNSAWSLSHCQTIARPPQRCYQALSTPGGRWAQCRGSQFLGTPPDLIPILEGPYGLLPIHLCGRLFTKYYFLLVIMMVLPVFQTLENLWGRIGESDQGLQTHVISPWLVWLGS